MSINRARQLRRQSTDAERTLWYHLRAHRFGGYKIRRQVPIAGFVADFVCHTTRLVIELDGGQHSANRRADAIRTAALEHEGFRVIRFWNNELTENLESVLDRIQQALDASAHPSPAHSRAMRANGRPPPQGGR